MLDGKTCALCMMAKLVYYTPGWNFGLNGPTVVVLLDTSLTQSLYMNGIVI